MPGPVATQSKMWDCGRSFAGIVGSNPTVVMDVCCECCILSGRGLSGGEIETNEMGRACGAYG